jgi:hypothetical protein
MLIGFLKPVPTALDSFCIQADLSSKFGCLRPALEARKRFGPLCSPVAHSAGVAALARLLKILGEFLVLIDVGTRR